MTDDSNDTSAGDEAATSRSAPEKRGGFPIHITLSGGREERFERIKRAISERKGYEPKDPEVLGLLMAKCGGDDEPVSEGSVGRGEGQR